MALIAAIRRDGSNEMIFHEEVSKKLADRGIINSWNSAMKYRSCKEASLLSGFIIQLIISWKLNERKELNTIWIEI